jgi:hypothetical protein
MVGNTFEVGSDKECRFLRTSYGGKLSTYLSFSFILHPDARFLYDKFQCYSPVHASFSQVVLSLQVSRVKLCLHFLTSTCVLHFGPTSSSLKKGTI